MDTAIIIAVIGLVGSLGGVYLAQRITARTARQAAQTTAELETRKLDQATWQEQYQGWRDDALKLRELLSAQEDRAREDRERSEQRISDLDKRLQILTRRLDDIQRERAKERAQLDSIISWCRVVVVLLRQAGVAYPPLPPGVLDVPPHSESDDN